MIPIGKRFNLLSEGGLKCLLHTQAIALVKLSFKVDKLPLKLVATELNALFPLNLILVIDNK